MRCGLLMIVPFIFMVLQGVCPAWSADALVLTEAENGKEVTVSYGTVIRVELQATGGTGYLWEMDDLDKVHFELINADTVHAAPPGMVGAPVMQVWMLKAKKRGKAQLQMHYYRPWEGKSSAVNAFRITINIAD